MSELPPGWTSATVADLIAPDGIFSDGDWVESKDQDPNGAIRLLQLADVGEGAFVDKSNRFVNDDKFEQLRCTEVFEGDVLIARMPDPLGRACLAPLLRQRCITVVDVAIVRPGPTSVRPRWLMHFLNAPPVRQVIELQSSGTTRRRISRGNLARLELPVPPLQEQKRIADKLDALLARVDACRGRLDRVPGILKRFRQSVLAAATSGELTREWREGQGRHGDVGFEHPEVLEEHGGWSSTLLPAAWRWMGFTECFDDETDSRRKLPQSEYDAKGEIAVVDQGDALVGGYTSRIDLASRAGLPAIVFGDHTRCVKFVDFPFVQGADGVKVLVPRAQVLIPQYAYLALQACRLPNKGYSRHMRFLRASCIPRPDLDEQVEIVRRAAALFSLVDSLGARFRTVQARIARLAPSALGKAFRGELVPQDPNDEAASELLARLRTRPSSTGNTGKLKRGGARGPRTKAKVDRNMLTRKDVTPTHLTTILNERGSLTAEALWSASQLEIDDFYDQLKDEEARGLLRENLGDSPTAPRVLEAAP